MTTRTVRVRDVPAGDTPNLKTGIEDLYDDRVDVAFVNEKDRPGHRTPFSTEFLVGPSVQFRPLPQVHRDIAPRAKVFVVFGYEF